MLLAFDMYVIIWPLFWSVSVIGVGIRIFFVVCRALAYLAHFSLLFFDRVAYIYLLRGYFNAKLILSYKYRISVGNPGGGGGELRDRHDFQQIKCLTRGQLYKYITQNTYEIEGNNKNT